MGRPSLSNGRPSIGRRSSVGVKSFGAGGARRSDKDPRNLQDAKYKKQNIKKVLHYLFDNGYEEHITEKVLEAPSVKTFQSMLLFLFRQIDPAFKYTGKADDDIIGMLKGIGYPYTVSKTSLANIGSPHTWANLLGVLSWIVELLLYDREARLEEEDQYRAGGSSGDFHDSNDGRLFFEYISSAYTSFLAGDDDAVAQLQDEFDAQYESKINALDGKNSKLQEEVGALQREYSDLKSTESQLPALEHQKAVIRKDTKKLQDFILNTKAKLQNVEQKVVDSMKELAERKHDRSMVEKEKNDLLNLLRTQELSPQDVERMMSEKAGLKATLEKTNSMRDAIQKDIWEMEMGVSKSMEALDDQTCQYNGKAVALQLVPSTAKWAGGADFEVKLNGHYNNNSMNRISSSNVNNLFTADVKGSIKPALKDLKEAIIAQMHKMRSSSLEVQEQLNQSEEEKGELAKKVSELRKLLAKAEDNFHKCKDDLEAEESRLLSDNEAVEREINMQIQCRNKEDDAISKMEEREEEVHRLIHYEMTSFENKREAVHSRIVSTLTALTEHKEYMERKVAELVQYTAAKVDSSISQL
jgi:kinetochore protein NDC80